MKKFILGTAALSAVGLVNVASAADLPVKAPPIVPVVYNWTGCSIGADGECTRGRFNESVDTKAGSFLIPAIGLIPFAACHVELDHVTDCSGAFGGKIGSRWENADQWVVGAEA